jgi:hypothetical protein
MTQTFTSPHREARGARWPAARFAAAALATVFAIGCGDSGPERIPVFPAEGKVVFNGQPVTGALVVLHPANPTDPKTLSARAQTEKDGTFKLSTYDTGDGVPSGEYTVTVEWRKLIQKDGEFKPGPNVLPAKYSQPTTSDLKVRIAEGPNVLEPFTLKR